MGQIIRCPLTGIPCAQPITIEEKSFFLAEAEKPPDAKRWRREAVTTVLEREHKYKIRSALDESDINAFTCKICEMIQTCAYGIADITNNNPNVLLELGMMIALGKPTIILRKVGQEEELKLPANIIDRDVITFQDYTGIMPKLRKALQKLPPPVLPPSPIRDLERIEPSITKELREQLDEVVKEFKQSIEEAKLDTILPREEKKEISPELSERIGKLEGTLKDLIGLGFTTDVKTAFLRGNYYYNQGKYNEALASYNWCLELKPDDPAALNNRGMTYDDLERYDDALADYNRSLERRPDAPDTLMNRGVTYAKLERYNESLADYNRSLELRPDDPDTLANRGATYRHLERYDESLADYNRSLERRPDDPDTLANRGATYVKLDRYEEALADFNRYQEIRPDHPSGLYNLACLFSLWGKADDSVAYLEKAIALNKKNRKDAKKDKDFDNIRDDPRFKELIELED